MPAGDQFLALEAAMKVKLVRISGVKAVLAVLGLTVMVAALVVAGLISETTSRGMKSRRPLSAKSVYLATACRSSKT